MSDELFRLLQSRFGFDTFRPHQETVCRSVIEGRDVLLVMPTGAGKSLCYQLPGLARGGVTLVISPLVALIEDQVQALKGRGLRAERIHSGRDREDSREVARAYLRGDLDFLFIAPERLGVPGFPEMLGRFPPRLIAVDEAHCISHWGHDFRPDYRLVGERLQALRAAPVIALTATATQVVQDDIAKQLGLKHEARFIQGFRRHNLGIEVVELNPSARVPAILDLLGQAGRLPAILYAPTRKRAEELSQLIGAKFRAACYHAGLPPAERDRVQGRFLQGDLDVIVATIAFGMGIDKPNVRTVVHAALPGSVEGYYQEIGRAGRDGLPSRAVLFHAFIDQRTHEFFFAQDYPEIAHLRKIAAEIKGPGTLPKDDLAARLPGLAADVFDKALEKLYVHGAVTIDPDENVGPGRRDWEKDYQDQVQHRRLQLQKVQEFTRAAGCRMLRLVDHFGDQVDDGSACGQCDRCRPEASLAVAAERSLIPLERHAAALILASLAGRDGQAAGRLFTDAEAQLAGLARSPFERLLQALALAGWVEIENESFEKDGRAIAYRKVSLTAVGRRVGPAGLAGLKVNDPPEAVGKSTKARAAKKTARAALPDRVPRADSPALFAALRDWRKSQARERGIPAFRVLSDRVLHEICETRPTDENQLLGVRGMGPKLVNQYGEAILRRVREV